MKYIDSKYAGTRMAYSLTNTVHWTALTRIHEYQCNGSLYGRRI